MGLKISVTAISTIGLLFLGACSSGTQTSTTPSSPIAPSTAPKPATPASPTARSTTTTNAKTGEEHKHGGQGGQVVESGLYHLEFVPKQEAEGIHLDVYVQKGDNHAPIPDAKVTAQVQMLDGSQKAIDLKYDPQDKHYTAIVPGLGAGEYKVAILSDINGEKVNGRFTFKQ